VPESGHLDQKGKRSTATLDVENLEYNSSEQDLRKALSQVSQKILVEMVTIPSMTDQLMYGFIEISWIYKAQMEILEICANNSQKVQVNSRPIVWQG
jgi:urate oxidase